MRLGALASVVAAAAVLAVGCQATRLKHERRYDRKQAQDKLASLEQPGLVIGEFTLPPDSVVDGDTIRVAGLGSTLRLLGLDAEETFKSEADRNAYEEGWEAYLKKMKGDSKRPVKMATPVGEEAKDFAKRFFAGVDTVILERDHPKEIRDYYNRYLAYVIVVRGGKRENYNVECVRAGMSPYFSKYGYSRRFHDDFVAAEKEARAAARGIWDPKKQHYPDYDERKKWWDKRGDFIRAFEKEAEGKEDFIILTNWDSIGRLEKHEGKEVTLLGAVGDIRLGDRGPTRVMLSRRMASDFPLVFFDKDAFLSANVTRLKGEYVKVRGYVSKYNDKRRKKYELQIVVNLPGQVSGPELPPEAEDAETD